MVKREWCDFLNMYFEKMVDIWFEYCMVVGIVVYLQKEYDKFLDLNILFIDLKENDIYEMWIDVDRLLYLNLIMVRYKKDLVYMLVRDKDSECKFIEWLLFKKDNKFLEELYWYLKCLEVNILFQIL